MSDPLFIRADASAEIGTGHVMRCLAQAQALQAGTQDNQPQNAHRAHNFMFCVLCALCGHVS